MQLVTYRSSAVSLGALATLLAGCVGSIAEGDEAPQDLPPSPAAKTPEGTPPPPASPMSSPTTPAGCGARPSLGPTPLRRLTRIEYRNTIADLFGIRTLLDADLPDDATDSRGFTTTTGQPTSPGGVVKYFEVAGTIGAALVPQLPTLFPCAAQKLDEAACVKAFLDGSGTRVFRRPLTKDEGTHFSTAFAKARAAGASFDEAAATLVQSMLVAPQFLFILEPTGGTATDARALTSWQVAARLSYLIWQTTPDAALLDAAARDELRSKPAVATHARRMLGSSRAKGPVASFFGDWLMIDEIEKVQKDSKLYPDVTKSLLTTLAQESRLFTEDLFWNQRGEVAKLLVSPSRVRSKTLSKFYGDVLSQSDKPETAMAPVSDKSFGLLSQAGLLMGIAPNDDSAIIYRGKFVRTHLLCQQIFLPPPGTATPLPNIKPGTTARQRTEAHTGGGACAGCHSQMDPFGFALEHFDGAGRWRDTENGLAIDTAARVSSSDIAAFDGALDLSGKLAASPMVRQCLVSQLFQYALRREPTEDDKCALDALDARFVASQLSLKDLLTEIIQSDAFLARVEPKEVQ